jgi:hypothetical protein
MFSMHLRPHAFFIALLLWTFVSMNYKRQVIDPGQKSSRPSIHYLDCIQQQAA